MNIDKVLLKIRPFTTESEKKIFMMKVKNHTINIVIALLRTIFLVTLGFLVLYPVFYMLSRSFMPSSYAAMDPSIVWVPKQFSIDNLKMAIMALDYWKSLGTTIGVEVISGMIQVLTCAVAAYGLSRFKFKGQGVLFVLVMLTIIIPPQAIIIPMYLNDVHLDFFGILGFLNKLSGIDIRPNIIDTPFTFYLPAVFGAGYRSGLFIFIYKQFFKGLPRELEEAAWIDGLGPLKTFLYIVIPTSGSAILCVSIFSIIWHWNEYYLSAMLLFNMRPLSVSLDMMSDTLWNVFYLKGELALNASLAGCLLVILPVLLLYLWLQKFFMQSIERVGIVG